MKTFFRNLITSLLLAASLGVAAPAFAGEASDLVKARRSEIEALMKDGRAQPERDKKVAAIMGGLFDFDAMAEASMGSEWAGLTDDQKTEFRGVLRQLIQRAIERNVKRTLNYDVSFNSEETAGDSVLVKTTAKSKTDAREEPFAIDYKVHKVGDTWRTTDIVTEGASLVSSYRSQFTRIMKKDGYAALIKKMKDKLAKKESDLVRVRALTGGRAL